MGKLLGERPLVRPRRRREDSIKMDCKNGSGWNWLRFVYKGELRYAATGVRPLRTDIIALVMRRTRNAVVYFTCARN